MKPWLRFFLSSALALLATAAARAQLSPTGISVSPGSALPGDTVTFAVSVSNATLATNFVGTSSFSILLTNITTGTTFTVTQAGVSPTSGFIAGATAAVAPTADAGG